MRSPDNLPYRSVISGSLEEVLEDTLMGLAAKREMLASWASDANAVPDFPQLRQLPDGSIVTLEQILSALRALDQQAPARSLREVVPPRRRFGQSKRPIFGAGSYSNRRSNHDDDDPPPCPAGAIPPRRGGGGDFVNLRLAAA